MTIPEELRVYLYPLGIISTIAFTLRFLIQWLQSEKEKKSVVTTPFWVISLLGNLSLGIHSIIQGQFLITIVQGINGMIASRNINLLQPKEKQWSFSKTLFFLFLSVLVPTLFFYFFSNNAWMRAPTHAFQQEKIAVSNLWHIMGMLGVILFASRFWVQWVQAELAHKSFLGKPFWILSLIGAILSIIYFASIHDYINLVGPLFGLIPYTRNLMLLKKA